MGTRFGLDFGTATTCVAMVDQRTLVPHVIEIQQGGLLTPSLVWFERNGADPHLIESRSRHDRHPKAVAEEAKRKFWAYWKSRVRAQEDSLKWHKWVANGREHDMLLSYFKPELADDEKWMTVADTWQKPVYDPMSQSTSVVSYVRLKKVPDPAPDTEDYVAGTAALLRHAVEAVFARTRERVSSIVLGMPSIDESTASDEAKRAQAHRLTAIEIAGIREDFGASDFRVKFCGEALAAAWGLDLDAQIDRPQVIVIDVGAGTSDLSLVEYGREGGSSYRPKQELKRSSIRWAGRDINAAIAHQLCESGHLTEAVKVMDPRAWQILLDETIESIKRGVSEDEARFKIPLWELAAYTDSGGHTRKQHAALHRCIFVDLAIGGLDPAMRQFSTVWIPHVQEFIQAAVRQSAPKGRIVSIDLVGGAFRFRPLRDILDTVLAESDLRGTPIRYRDEADAAQTVVARGLARHAYFET